MFDGHAILDDGRLKEMVGDDEEFIVEILELYLDTVGVDVAALGEAVQSAQWDEVTRLAHTVKGASGNVGADAMMEVARRLEEHATTEDGEGLAAAMANMDEVYARTVKRIQARLAG